VTEPTRTRQELWDERHAARDPIEDHAPDPTLVEVAAGLAPGTALDLGCGDGRNASFLAGAGWRVTGVDFSAVGLARAASRAAERGLAVDWLQADLLTWTPPVAAFDLVIIMFIHLPEAERERVHAAAAAAVAPGGTLLVVGHDRTNLSAGVGGPQDPDVLFTAGEIASTLPGEFEIVRADTVRRGSGERVPIDAVLVARRKIS
jgi:2-polyprenyl-3-methyl-5-hydroxy-6-metoxy-1,4-benzoquinol methylase